MYCAYSVDSKYYINFAYVAVSIPNIEWVDDCLQNSDGQRNMKCMTWKEETEKVINVICLLKCEAKKMAAAGDADKVLDEIRVNMYLA